VNTTDVLIYVAASVPAWLLMLRVRRLGPASQERAAVSVIIPARNEERNIEGVVRAVLAQTTLEDEVIVVDDDSTDETAQRAREAGAKVVQAGELPAGWLGKPHACWVGASQAKNGILLFVDADVLLHHDALNRLTSAVQRDRSALISVQPFHEPRRWGEHAALPFNIVSVIASGAGRRSQQALAFGPVLACDTERYRHLGGHSAHSVRGSVVEDIALGRLFGACQVFLGSPDTVTFRMYPNGLASLVRGFSKNMASGAASARGLSLVAALAWVAAQTGALFTSPVLYVFAAAQMWWMGRKVGRFSVIDAAFYPLHLAVFFAVLIRSAMFRVGLARVSWAGRRVR
jgi:4,4'-diaponeurosporenoate glycosyltransferase